MRKFQVTIEGKTPLLMHADNIDWADHMEDWKNNPKNRKVSKAGDDRSPAWRWLGSLHHDDELICVPADYIMRALMEAGAMVPVPGGKSGKTFKSQTQSGMMVDLPFWPLVIDSDIQIAMKDVHALMKVDEFKKHREIATELGFSLFMKRAKIGTSKHIRVRPRFDNWSASGTLSVWDEQITDNVLSDIFTYAGQYKGLGDWRPGGRTPGSFGMFSATVKQIQ